MPLGGLLITVAVAWIVLFEPCFLQLYLLRQLPMNNHFLLWLSGRWFLYGIVVLGSLTVLMARPAGGPARSPPPSWWMPWLAWIGWAGISIAYSVDRGSSLHGWLALASCGLLAYAAHRVVATRDAGYSLSRFLVWVAIATALYGMVQYGSSFRGAVPLFDQLTAQGSVGIKGWWGQGVIRDILDRGRIFSVFAWPNLFAGFLLLTLPLTLGCARSSRSRIARVGYRTAALLLGTCLLLTRSVGAWVAAILTLSLAVPLISSRRRSGLPSRRAAPRLLLWVATALLASAALVIGSVLLSGPAGSFAASSVRSRIVYAIGAMSVIARYPLTGTGIGTFGTSYWALMPPRFLGQGHSALHAHNAILEWTAEMGLVGLAILAWLLYALWPVVGEGIQDDRRAERTIPRRGLAIGVLAFFLHGLIEQTMVDMAVAPFWWIAIGALSGTRVRHERDRATEQSSVGGRLAGSSAAAVAVVALLLVAPLAAASSLAGSAELLALEGRGEEGRAVLARAQRWDPITSRYPLEEASSMLRQAEKARAGDPPLLQGAEARLRRAVTLSPWSGAAWLLLGETQLVLGKQEEALASFLSAMHWNPHSQQAAGRVASLANAAGRYGDLIDAGRRFQQLAPLSPLGYFWEALGWQGREDAAQAVGCYQLLVARFPGYARGLLSFAKVLRRYGATSEAQHYYAAFLATEETGDAAERVEARGFLQGYLQN